MTATAALLLLALAQGTTVDTARILEKADALLQEAKTQYETGRDKASPGAFVEAGFKLEEAHIKYMVLQEIGGAPLQNTVAERLRSINQLAKLIHDGRVAISGAPAPAPAPATPKTPDAPAAPAAPEAPKVEARPAVDVTKRAPMPDAAQQREAEKLIKDLFKDQYAKKAPADRKILGRLLLKQAGDNVADVPAFWVLCREAQDAAAQACDLPTLIAAVELAGHYMDVDVLALKVAGLTTAGKTAKSPEECGAVVEASDKLLEELAAADDYDSAEKLATASVALAKRAGSVPLTVRSSLKLRDLTEAKQLYTGMRGVLETLGKTPDQPAANFEMGQYLCYVKGSWDLGLRFLVKGSDPAIQSLAEKELAQPSESVERVALADGWFDLAEKEKSALRKARMQEHAKGLYESAVADAPALLKMKIEKRLASLGGSAPASSASAAVDLLKLINPLKDVLKGTWTPGQGGALTSSSGQALIVAPYILPDEYDLRLTVVPKKGVEVYLGLVVEKVQFDASIDAWAGTITGFGSIDGKLADVNETGKRVSALKSDAPNAILCSVRKTSVSLTVNGALIASFKPEPARLSMNQFWQRPVTGTLAVGGWVPYTLTRLELVPVSGKGRTLR